MTQTPRNIYMKNPIGIFILTSNGSFGWVNSTRYVVGAAAYLAKKRLLQCKCADIRFNESVFSEVKGLSAGQVRSQGRILGRQREDDISIGDGSQGITLANVAWRISSGLRRHHRQGQGGKKHGKNIADHVCFERCFSADADVT
jgi:hypothetical protein